MGQRHETRNGDRVSRLGGRGCGVKEEGARSGDGKIDFDPDFDFDAALSQWHSMLTLVFDPLLRMEFGVWNPGFPAARLGA